MENSANVARIQDLFAFQKGFVEDITDPKGSGRIKVRIIGKEYRQEDDKTIPEPPTADLPWATVMMPVDNAGGTATAASTHNIKVGDIVWCFFINGDSKQRVVVGVQNAVANASTEKPPTEPTILGRYVAVAEKDGNSPNPNSHIAGNQPEKNKNLGTQGIGGQGSETASRLVNSAKDNGSIANQAGTTELRVACAKGAGENPASQLENVLAEMFATLQHTNGNIGSYYISKYTGGLFNYQKAAQGYIKRAQAIINAAITRAFGELMALLKKGVQALIKALLAPIPGVLGQVVKWFTTMLEKLGCTMDSLIDRISNFVEGVLMGYIGNVVSWAACQVKRFTDAILGRVLGEMSGIINTAFGGLSSVLGALGSAVDMVGGAISSVMSLLGIQCSGNAKCSGDTKKKSTKEGSKSGLEAGYNDLDELLNALESGNHLPIDSYCGDATTDPEPKTEINVWGPQVPPGTGGGTDGGGDTDSPFGSTDDTKSPTGIPHDEIDNSVCASRSFRVEDILEVNGVKEGEDAIITLRRLGNSETSSSATYYTVDGTAKAGEDYCPVNGFVGWGVGETERTITVKTLDDGVEDGNKYFFVKMNHDGCGDLDKPVARIWITDNGVGTQGSFPTSDIPDGLGVGGVPSTLNTDQPAYFLSVDKQVVYEGETVTFNLTTFNVADGETVNYTIGRESTGITVEDIAYVVENGDTVYPTIPSDLGRTFTVQDNKASVTIALVNDGIVEDTNEIAEQLFVTLNNLGVSAGVSVLDSTATSSSSFSGKTLNITADKVSVFEGESVKFTLTGTGFADNEKVAYTIFGPNINESDVLQPLEGTVFMEDNKAEFVVDVLDDNLTEVQENLIFACNEFGASATVVIRASVETPALTPGVDRGDDDDGTPEFDVPIIDADGSIIDIEVKKSGHRYRSVPFISIDSNVGFGAIVEPILNSNGYLSRVRVIRGGQGYQGKTRPTNVVCQLVGFTMTNVGGLYDTAPTVYVDGKSDIARAILSPQGYVEEIQLLEGGQSYNEVPEVIITGGGGFGAKAKADLQCVPAEESELILQGLARDPANYVDCP